MIADGVIILDAAGAITAGLVCFCLGALVGSIITDILTDE